MRVMTLGEVKSLPSSESVLAALRGEPGGWSKVLFSTLLRALLVAPGVWLGGARGGRLVAGSLVASTSITAFLFLWFVMQGEGRSAPQTNVQPVPAPGPSEG